MSNEHGDIIGDIKDGMRFYVCNRCDRVHVRLWSDGEEVLDAILPNPEDALLHLQKAVSKSRRRQGLSDTVN